MTDSMADILPTLPEDLRPAAQDLYLKASEVTWDAEETLKAAYKILREAKGDPDRLDSGAELLRSVVAAQIAAARDDIDTGTTEFAGSWSGGGAEAFAEYLPALSGAMASMEESATSTADAVGEFRRALTELWQRIVDKTWHAGGEITAAIAQAGPHRSNAIPAVLGIVARFASYVGGIATALLNLANQSYKAEDKLAAAKPLPAGVVRLSADGPGPGGPQLPVPGNLAISGDWSAADRKDNWQPASGEVRLDTGAMSKMVNTFRENGAYWDAAARVQADAADGHLTAKAFGLGVAFYGDVAEILVRDRELYRHANGRMDAVADALSDIGQLYGMLDEEFNEVLYEQLRNE